MALNDFIKDYFSPDGDVTSCYASLPDPVVRLRNLTIFDRPTFFWREQSWRERPVPWAPQSPTSLDLSYDYVSSYYYICVLVLLYMCTHTNKETLSYRNHSCRCERQLVDKEETWTKRVCHTHMFFWKDNCNQTLNEIKNPNGTDNFVLLMITKFLITNLPGEVAKGTL